LKGVRVHYDERSDINQCVKKRGYLMATKVSTNQPSSDHRTVGRVMSILELVVASESRGMRLGDLATALAAPKSSLHALTKGLLSTGYLREVDGRYVVGPAITSLITAEPTTARFAYHHLLSELAEQWNETVMLATLVGDSVVYIDCVQPDILIRANPNLNRRLTLWPRSSGKVFLAHMDEKRLNGYVRRNHPDAEDSEQVRAEVAKVREVGMGINVGQSGTDHLGLAVPIILGHASVTTAISIAGPRARMEERVDDIAKSVRAAVESLPSSSNVG